MSCLDWEEQLSARLDGELSPASEADLEEHLLACPSCRERAKRLERASQIFQDLSPEASTEEFDDKLWQRLEQENLPRDRRMTPGKRFWLPLAGLVAASLVLVLDGPAPESARFQQDVPRIPASRAVAPDQSSDLDRLWAGLRVQRSVPAETPDLAEIPCLSSEDCGPSDPLVALAETGDLSFIPGWCEGRLVQSPACRSVEEL